MGEIKTFTFLVSGGEASAGPPIGPALGPLGVNVTAIIRAINEKTADYKGMKVPVKVHIDVEKKTFKIDVGLPTTTALIAKEAGIERGSGNPKTEFVGNISMEIVKKIAKLKIEKTYAKDLKSVAKEIVGTCISMGVKVEGKDPREIMREIEEGRWDELLLES